MVKGMVIVTITIIITTKIYGYIHRHLLSLFFEIPFIQQYFFFLKSDFLKIIFWYLNFIKYNISIQIFWQINYRN